MQVSGTKDVKYILLQSINPGAPNGGSGTQYFVGSFDGKNFKLDPSFEKGIAGGKGIWLDFGRDNYAGVTWSDIPKEDGRRLFMGWMSNWDYAQVVPTEKWRSAMTLPRTLELVKKDHKYQLISKPVETLKKIRKTTMELSPTKVENTYPLPVSNGINLSQCELNFAVSLPLMKAKEFGILLENEVGESYRFGYRKSTKHFFCEREVTKNNDFSPKFAHKREMAARTTLDPIIEFQIFIDRSSIEIFADNGETVLTEIFFPSKPFNQIKLFSKGGDAVFTNFKVYGLKRIW